MSKRKAKVKWFLGLLSLILGLIPVSARAQGVSVQGQAVVNTTTSVSGIPGNSVLQAVPNAQITVCSSAGGGIPCSPLVTIYSNVALTVVAANPLTADANGNFSFFVAPNATGYIYSQTGSGIVGQLFTIAPQSTSVTSLNATNLVGPGSVTGAYTHSGTETFTGGITSSSTNDQFKSLESVKYADQFAAAAVAAPVNAPGILNTATGGSVAANTYACEVTFNGGTTGETTASPASTTTITGGATSTLFCAPNDASTSGGAATYNVYWQTGGAGSYWKGHASVTFGTMDSQTTTPATSGTNPPVSNTATGIIAGASAAAGTPGVYVIPSGVASGAGSPGDPTAPATVFDYRNGSLNLRATTPPPYMTESGSTFNNVLNIVAQPAALGTRQQVNGIQSSVYLGTPTWGNTLPSSFGNAAFHGCYRFGTRTEGCGAHTDVIYVANLNATSEGQEIDSNNASGGDANSSGPTGLNVFDVGANRSWIGVNVAPQGAGHGFASSAFNSGDGNTPAALSVGATCATLTAGLCPASSPSQVINITSVNSGATRLTFAIGEDAFGNALLEPPTGNIVAQAGASQVANLKFGANTALRSYTYPDVSTNIPGNLVMASSSGAITTNVQGQPGGMTAFSWPVIAGTTHSFECELYYQISSVTGVPSPAMSVGGTATYTTLWAVADGYQTTALTTTGSVVTSSGVASSLVTTASTPTTTNLPFRFRGGFVVNVGGTFLVQAANSLNAGASVTIGTLGGCWMY